MITIIKYILALYFIASILVMNGLCFSQIEQPDSNQTLDEVIIKEVYESSMNEQKFPIHLNVNYTDVVKIPERIDWSSVNSHPIDEHENNWQHLVLNFSSPEHVNITPAPVKVFHIQFKNVRSWKLQIFESDGSLFKVIEGKGNPQQEIPWDGKGNNGNMFMPGYNYSYSFTPIDKAGNKRTFPGQTFSISSAYLFQGDTVWIGIAGSKIFSYDGFGMVPNAKIYAKEVATLYRYYSKKGSIIIQSSHKNYEQFSSLLAKELYLEEKLIRNKKAGRTKDEYIIVLIE